MRDVFFATFPVWTVVDAEQFRGTQNIVRSLPVIGSDELGKFFPVFTDDDLAKRFIEDWPLPGKAPLQLITPRALWDVLTELKPLGCGHVGIDVSLRPTIRGRFYPISEVLEALKVDPPGP
jgi:hypothetical protein